VISLSQAPPPTQHTTNTRQEHPHPQRDSNHDPSKQVDAVLNFRPTATGIELVHLLLYLNLLYYSSYEVRTINTSGVTKFQLPLRPSQPTVRQTYTLTGNTDGSEKLPDARGAFIGLGAADGSAYNHPRSSRAEVK